MTFGARAALAAVILAAWLAPARSRPGDVPFAKRAIDAGASETAAFADINGDGRLDIVSGELWFEAPRWTPRRFRELPFLNNYVDNFSDLPLDVNQDGRIDIVSCSWFSRNLTWWENPGKTGGAWKQRVFDSGATVEAAILADLDNDGKAEEVLPQFGTPEAPVAWYELRGGAFVKHVAHPTNIRFGIGAGDVNGDGRNDIVTAHGWLEAPPNPRSGAWTLRPEWKFEKHLSFIYVLDMNGDGRNDLLTSYGHDYGVFWMEQAGGGKWATHTIDDSWSQAHAPALADLNGDGRADLVAGKRYMAHNGRDPGEKEPLGIYWYQWEKVGSKVEFTRHVIDYSTRAGGGMQVALGDLDGDGDLDFAVGGKSGLFLFENLSKKMAR